MLEVTTFLEPAYVAVPPRDLLRMPVTAMKPVTEEIAQFLGNELQIDSFFDLAVSSTFKEAISLAELEDAVLTDLPGITDDNLSTVTGLLSINTVIDAAQWPPFVIAQHIFTAAFDLSPVDNPDAPAELLPIAKKHATERVFYTVISLDEIDNQDSSADDLTKLVAPVDLLSIINQELGFEKPAKGTIFTFCQAWYPEGVSLGQLLHSLALAPGESTKIAVIDWTRREAAQLMKKTGQSERLANSLVQGRAITEIGSAVAQESQFGFSRLDSYAESYSKGRSKGPLLAGLLGGHGTSSGSSEGSVTTTVISGSHGRRNIETEMSQNIQSHSQQYATAARSRFASAVQEVEQTEREELRTRIITNYNHSHALSMHYYEVVQIYRVTVEVSKREACLFVPMVILDFEKNPKLIEAYRSVLAQNALSDDIKHQIINFEKDTERGLVSQLASVLNDKQRLLNEIENEENRNAIQQWLEVAVDKYVEAEIENYKKVGVRGSHIENGWRLPAGTELVGVDMYDQALPGGLTICPSSLKLYKQNRDRVDYPIEATKINDVVPAIPVTDLRGIYVELSPPSNDKSYLVAPRLHLRYGSDDFVLSFFGVCKGTDRTLQLGSFYGSTDGNQLGRLLNENRLYYSQRVYESLTPNSIALLLSNYTYNGQRLVEVIDPTPLMSYGNYLVFKHFYKQEKNGAEANQALVEEHQTYIPLPTGGVFAEAVLGRFNASEKLDITRFWDWQESPIPHQAPDIAPLQSGSRATDPGLTTGELEGSIVNIMNPQPLPEPAGTSALLNALTVANMFRDMSGLPQATLLAQTGLTEVGESARTGAQIASENLQAWVDAAANVAAAYFGAQTGRSTGKSNSTAGALINHGQKLDSVQRSPSGGSRGSSTPAISNGGGGGGSTPAPGGGGGNLIPDNGGGGSSSSGSQEIAAFRSAINPGSSVGDSLAPYLHLASAVGRGTGTEEPDWPEVKNNLVFLALQEWEYWDRGKKNETQMVKVVEDYWQTGVGVSMPSIKTAWSAAFISWIVRVAGAKVHFRYSARHWVYAAWAKENRLAISQNPFWLYDITEIAPEPGDILCKARSNSGITYENVNDGQARNSHCDIVVAVRAGEIDTVGGNLATGTARGGSVRKDTLKARPDGRVNTNAADQEGYYGVIRIHNPQPRYMV